MIEDSVTCLEAFKRGTEDEYAIGQLLIGTEKRWLYTLNQSATMV